MSKNQVGMIGLAVMGANLIRNLERNGYSSSLYNRTWSVTEQFMTDYGKGNFTACKNLEEFVNSLETPRKIFIMIQAGPAVDAVLNSLYPLLSKGDIILEGGNAFFRDTIRRENEAQDKGLRFLGVGISGGEEGALNGASIMPGGPRDAWGIVSPMLEKISAHAPNPCTDYIGPNGAGHFVKMVHNGIEYGDMQLIAEAYDLLKRIGNFPADKLSKIFNEWNAGVLQSYLIEITAKVLAKKDPEGDGHLVDKILDKAGQKGTGKWTSQIALDLGVAIPTISAAVDARGLSALKSERILAAQSYAQQKITTINDVDPTLNLTSVIHDALYVSKIISYAQGMALLASASVEYSWDLQLGNIAALWKGGCIIRARFLDEIRKAYDDKSLKNLLMAPSMREAIQSRINALRSAVALAATNGIPVPAFSASLSYFDAYTTADLPQNLTQGQRDFFGAHTYQRKDKDGVFHTEW